MTIEVTAKKVDDAINQGLAQLGATLDQVTVEVVEPGGLFRKAKVRLTLDADESAQAPQKSEGVEAAKPAAAEKADKPEKAEKPSADASAAKKESAAPADKADKASKPSAAEPKPKAKAAASAKKTEGKSAPKKPAEHAADSAAEGDKPAAKPRVLRDEDKAAAAKALEFVKQTVAKMGFEDAEVVAADAEHINITAPAGDDSLIIGRHGETLSALAYLAETGARAEKCHINVTVDCNGYRDRRAASLTAMARRRADECANKHRKIKLEPMERADRRTIHNALTDDERVTTASEGKEPHRYIVIYPKNKPNV